jgi:general secretion pathway protein I|tara:strand:- start:2534 stop:2899 length:366 start_codon:yes stop_codon:yes gene_type:complete
MNKKPNGFTLVEILVALTILAITMGAYLGQLDSQVKQTHTLRNRTLAHWAGQNHLATLRIQNQWPDLGAQTFSAVQGQQKWQIRQQISATPNTKIKRIELQMFAEDGEFSGSLVGYIAHEQ